MVKSARRSYVSAMSKKLQVLCVATVATCVTASSSAFAGNSKPLPGVKQPEPLVQAPLPEPTTEPQTPGTFKVGDFDVKVSGSITIDVGVGRVKPPR